MSRSAPIQRMIFLHIGRTGGTTFRTEILYKSVDPSSIFLLSGSEPQVRSGTMEDLLNMAPKEQNKLRVIFGHMPFGLRDQLACPDSWHYATFLREPVARTVSDYYQHRDKIDHPCHAQAMSYNLEEFVRAKCGLSWNGMCQWLSNAAFGKKFESSEDMYKEALRNAEACTFIGLTDFYGESIRRLCRLCGWRLPKYEPQYSLTPRNRSLSLPEREILHAHTVFDRVLYQHFHDRFLQQRQEKSSFMGNFKWYNYLKYRY